MKDILVETPYHHDGVMKTRGSTPTFTSDSSISRMYEPLIEFDAKQEMVRFFKLKATDKVIGVVRRKKPDTKEDSNEIIFTLRFKHKHTLIKTPTELKGKKILQVDKVFTDEDFRGEGFASLVYITLAQKGFIVISDSSQFTDGKMLWKKMAREAHAKDYNVFILDDEYGFVKGEDGKVMKYDSKNIDDAKIWTKGQDFAGEHILLVMTK